VIIGQAKNVDGSIRIEVGPGGGLTSIVLTDAAMRLGQTELADTILDLVRTATAQANQRVKHTMREQLGELSDDELTALGIGHDARLTEAVESTTPDTWRLT
jgi:uncharacterized protein YjiS (DUF1127 family)